MSATTDQETNRRMYMKCKVCGAESGKYPLCINCIKKKEQGQIIKCPVCHQWHEAGAACPSAAPASCEYLYEPRSALLSQNEIQFFQVMQACIPAGYCVFPQINLAAFIVRTDQAAYHNELFRNIDFLITDAAFAPKIAVEINDQSHLTYDRKKRDQKVHQILEEAGIPLLTLWTSYGANPDYIRKRIGELLQAPVIRVRHSAPVDPQPVPATPPLQTGVNAQTAEPAPTPDHNTKKKQGCYIATCVYGSYNCPQVWVFRRFRDLTLRRTWLGRAFIRCYYAISPALVRHFGKYDAFRNLCRRMLNPLLLHLQKKGVSDAPYVDPE